MTFLSLYVMGTQDMGYLKVRSLDYIFIGLIGATGHGIDASYLQSHHCT